MQPTTTQYINSLLYHLEKSSTDEDKKSESAILFSNALSDIELNYTATSIRRLDKFLEGLSQKYKIEQLLSAEGGGHFFLFIAGYIGHYIAKQTGLPIIWHDYKESEHWRKSEYQSSSHLSNQLSNQSSDLETSEPLPRAFAFSISATIGKDFVCLPLMGVQNAMLGKGSISNFIAELQSGLNDAIPIDPMQEANELCKELLSMVSTGKLINPKLEFYNFLKEITFDYSLESLQQLDDALLDIKAHIRKKNQNYQALVEKPSFHQFVFLLGFYTGMTSAKLADTSTRWMNHEQALSLTDKAFPFCLEHASIQAFGSYSRTPLLMINNRLFDLTPDYLDSAVDYAKEVIQENSGNLHQYGFDEGVVVNINNKLNKQSDSLPPLWKTAMEKAGFLLSNNLVTLLNDGYADDYIIPTIYEYDELNDVHYISSSDSEDSIELAYEHLAENPKNSPFIVVIYEGYADLPTGRMSGLVVEVRGFVNPDRVDFDETTDTGTIDIKTDIGINIDINGDFIHHSDTTDDLVVQFVLPYRKVSHEFGLAIYPLVNSQAIDKPKVQALANALYKGAIEYKSLFIDEHLWADYYLNDFNPWQSTPLYERETQLDKSSIIEVEFELFPVQEDVEDLINKTVKSYNQSINPKQAHRTRLDSNNQKSKNFGSDQYNKVAVKFW